MIAEFLRQKVSLFEGLEDEHVNLLAGAVCQQNFAAGQTVVFRGASVDGLHIVASGKVGVHAKVSKTQAPVKVAELGPGEVFGEMSILEVGMAGATIKCVEDSLIYLLPEQIFRDLIDRHPGVQQRTMELIASRRTAAAAPAPAPASAPMVKLEAAG